MKDSYWMLFTEYFDLFIYTVNMYWYITLMIGFSSTLSLRTAFKWITNDNSKKDKIIEEVTVKIIFKILNSEKKGKELNVGIKKL